MLVSGFPGNTITVAMILASLLAVGFEILAITDGDDDENIYETQPDEKS